MARYHAAFFGVATCLSGAVSLRKSDNDVLVSADDNQNSDLSKIASVAAQQTLDVLSDTVFDPSSSVNIHESLRAVESNIDHQTAFKALKGKDLPKDVANLVQTVDTGDASGFANKFDEKSLDKARVALNDLVEKAWLELDDKIFKCKGFEDMNRENFGQVTRDINRIIEQINDLERVEAEAIEGINMKEQEILDAEALLAKETKLYNIEYAENKAELTIRQNDLAVFQFILEFTKCEKATSLSQICETRSGRKTLKFQDPTIAAKYRTLLTPASKRSVDQILRTVEGSSLMQQPSNQTTPPPKPKEPVKGEEDVPCVDGAGGLAQEASGDCEAGCSPNPPDCGLLHDKLSLMWGEYKDKVDELTMEMMKNELEFLELKDTLNAQIRMLSAAKARFQMLLGEARSNLIADRSELKEKYHQKAKLDAQYTHYMRLCKARICWIMHQDICAIKVVRNAVLENSTTCPSASIQDCVLDDWTKHSCSVSCDDSCDPSTPFKCGGWAKMTRSVVAQPDQCGLKCPLLEKQIRCGQYKCPLDCDMSEWSGWSKCTADCEGGLQSHTRNILVKPKNGGMQCNTVEESRPCNSQSCDRNCRLGRWTKWTPCSVACGGGFQEAKRHVLIPTRGMGKCPKESSGMRYKRQRCNTQDCTGDEICIAKQDLIVALDASGSVREDGFKILRNFAITLLKRYQTKYFGEPAMKIGIVQFGNGIIMPDGKTVSPAIARQQLTNDMTQVLASVEGLETKKGFTNLAQAFAMAEDMFIKKSRRGAQHSVMIITDGRPSFNFMTNEMVEQLDDKKIMRYFVVVGDCDDAEAMQKWASQPWETNLIHVQGLVMLEADMDLWAEKSLTKFCPLAYSPTIASHQEATHSFAHVKDSGWCGEKDKSLILSKTVGDSQECAGLAANGPEILNAKCTSFLLGAFFRRGWCICNTMAISSEQYTEWTNNKEDPQCKEGDGWKSSMLFDFYALEPTATGDSTY